MSNVTLVPFGPRVLLGELGPVDPDIERAKDRGIALPAELAFRNKLMRGLVIEVGHDVPYIEREMTVYFDNDTAFEIDGKVVINMHDILAYEKPKEGE